MRTYQTLTEQAKNDQNINPVLATSHNNSDKYRLAESWQIINVIESKGFKHVETSVAKARKAHTKGKQKHIMIFERDDLIIDDNNRLRLLVTNAHDGSSSLIINIGVFRAVCANGLVAGKSFFERRLKHVGSKFYSDLSTIINEAISEAPKLKDLVLGMQNVELSLEQADNLARSVAPAINHDIIFAADFLKCRRSADNKNDLWTVLNRIQESVIRGGVRYFKNYDNGDYSIKKTRKITSITKQRELNQFVFDKALELYELTA